MKRTNKMTSIIFLTLTRKHWSRSLLPFTWKCTSAYLMSLFVIYVVLRFCMKYSRKQNPFNKFGDTRYCPCFFLADTIFVTLIFFLQNVQFLVMSKKDFFSLLHFRVSSILMQIKCWTLHFDCLIRLFVQTDFNLMVSV